MRLRGRYLKDASGAAAVEFALISPALFMLIVGGFQLAWTLHCAATVRWALETNARALMLNPSESSSTLKSAMVSSLNGKATASDLTVTITQDTSNPNGTLLVATSTYSTTLAIPFMDSHPLSFTSTTKVPTF
jgi:Flp pilus assembly protein TadG